MNNYIFFKMIDGVNGCKELVRRRVVQSKAGSAVIGEVLVMIVVVAMAAIFKSGGLKFIQDIWTTMTFNSGNIFLIKSSLTIQFIFIR